MDPITHAASGAAAMLVLKNRPAIALAAPLAAIVCASPDIDIFFARTPVEFLQIHRGITHSLAGIPFFALALALLCYPLWREKTPLRWKFPLVWLFCAAMILLHIWLDVVTTYGTMIFLPFSHYRVRLNGIFIIDFLVTLPLLWAIWRWRSKRRLMAFVMAWIFFYPALCVALNGWHTRQSYERLEAENRKASQLCVLPDAFAPFFWRLIFAEDSLDDPSVRSQGLDAVGRPRTPESLYRAAPETLVRKLVQDSFSCDVFFRFALLPVMEDLRVEDMPLDLDAERPTELYMFYDLRFGSDLEFVRKILAMRPDADIPFQLLVELFPAKRRPREITREELIDNMELGRIRLRFSDSGRDSRWHKPAPPAPPTFWQWLAGMS